QVAPFLYPALSSGSTFQNGDLRAHLSNGVIRVQHLALQGSTAQVLVEGTVTLSGRLSLEVTANTSQLVANPSLLRWLGLRLPAAGPVPVGVLLEVSTYLANRLVHLRVSGTVRQPSVQVEPLSLLTQEAFNFFLNRADVPLP